MKVDIYDTHVILENGNKMHFDVLVQSDEQAEKAKAFAHDWLMSIKINPAVIIQESCQYCHTASISADYKETIRNNGYAIIQMEGCPEPI